MQTTTTTTTTIRRPTRPAHRAPAAPFEPAQWLWCLHCGRFFQGRDARADAIGSREACAFAGCDGAGYGVDVFDWDAWPSDDPVVAARWPSLGELYKGRVARPWSDEDGDDDLGCESCDALGDGCAWIEPRVARLVSVRDARADTVSHFRDLSRERLEELLRDDSIGVHAARCGRGPSVATVLAFLRAWPEVRAHGHTAPGDDGATAIAVEGLECDLLEAEPSRWDAIREAFHDAFGGADEYFNESDWLYAWWE